MPRVADIYSYPPGTEGAPDTTISSTKYNAFITDVQQDLNLARPILAGGTGATGAEAARTNLQTEVSMQAVTNYSSHQFRPGSFSSAPGATDAPDVPGGTSAQFFYGFALGTSPGTRVLLYAWNLVTPSLRYERAFDTISWGPWKRVTAVLPLSDGEGIAAVTGDMWYGVRGGAPFSYFAVNTKADLSGTDLFTVSKAGAINMTADLGLRTVGVNTTLLLDKNAGAGVVDMRAANNAAQRWIWRFIDGTAETGANAGSNFILYALSDAGGVLSAPLTINRANGAASFGGNVTVSGALGISGQLNAGGAAIIGGALTANAGFNAFSSSLVQGFFTLKNFGATHNNNQLRFVGLNAGIDLFAIGTDISTGNGSRQFQIYNFQTGGVPFTADNATVTIGYATASSSPTTGALVVNGGLGVVGALSITDTMRIGINLIAYNGTSYAIYSNAGLTTGMYLANGTNAWAAISDARLPYKKSGRELIELPSLAGFHIYERTDGETELFAKAQEFNELFPHIVKQGSTDDNPPRDMAGPDAWGLMYERMGAIALAYAKQHEARLERIEQHLVL